MILLEVTMNLEINKNLFAAWCGMIISGYDLFDNRDKEILYLCKEIKNKLYDDRIVKHFALSKTNAVECNPYYPRASDLSVYCFYIDKTLDAYYAFLDYCGDTEHRNPDFREWIEKSESYIRSIRENKHFSELFCTYYDIINNRFTDIDSQIALIKDKLTKYNLLADIKMIFAPNLLQSKYLADYALIDNKLYIIAADFREKTIIHEYLHIITKVKQKEIEILLQEKDIKDFVNIAEMQKLGFLKDFSLQSQIHALEETFVRYYTDLLTK